MAYLNDCHLEAADIKFLKEELGYTFINASEKELPGRKSLKEVVLNAFQHFCELAQSGKGVAA